MEVGREYSSWEQFFCALHQYSKENNVTYALRMGKTVESTNANDSVQLKFPEKFKFCYARMACTHNSKFSDASQGSGGNKRSSTSCPSSILVVVSKERTALVIHEAQLLHNHESVDIVSIDKRHYGLEELKKASVLLNIGVPPLCVQNALNCNKISVSKSIHETDGSDIDMDYLASIEEFLAVNPGCQTEMIDFNITFGAISIQTTEMKERMVQFTDGSLQIISHNISGSKFNMVCIMGVDKDLETHVFAVLVSPVINDRVIQHFLESFVKNNSQFCDFCRGAVVDLNRENADFLQILIPQMHVAWSRSLIIQQFEEIAENSVCMSIKPLSILKEMMNSESEQKYTKILKTYLALADPVSAEDFLEKWDSCKNLWVQYEIASSEGLEHQKSAVEMDFINTFCKFASVSTSLNDIMKCVLHSDDKDSSELEEELSLNPSSAWYKSSCVPYASEMILNQIAVADNSVYEISDQVDKIIVKRLDNDNEFILNPEGNKCNCICHLNTGLPCQHIFAWLKFSEKPYCDESLIPCKWRAYGRNSEIDSDPDGLSLDCFPSASIWNKRLKAVQNVVKKILYTCESHSYSDLGEDLILLRRALNSVEKRKLDATKNGSFLSSCEKSDEPASLSQTNNTLVVENVQKTKRGRMRKKEKELLSPPKPSQPITLNSLPGRRHNLRTNIKHKFVTRSNLTPVVDGQKGKLKSEGNSQKIGLVEEEKYTSANGPKKARLVHETEVKIFSKEVDEFQSNGLESSSKRKQEKKAPKAAEETIENSQRRGLKRHFPSENSEQNEERKLLSENAQPHIERSREDVMRYEMEEKDSDEEKGTDVNGGDSNDEDDDDDDADDDDDDDDDGDESADNDESKEQRDADLAKFFDTLLLDELQQLMQAVSILEVPGEKSSVEHHKESISRSPSEYLISSLCKEEDAVNLIMNLLCKTCFGYDKYTYKVVSSVIVKAFLVRSGVSEMMQTVYPWPSHLPDSTFKSDNTASLNGDQTLTVCGHKLLPVDLNTLDSDQELSQKVIHAYLEVLAQRHNGRLFVIPFEVVHHWRNGNFSHMIFKKVHFKTFDYLVLPIHCGSEISNQEEGIKPIWMSLIADVHNKTVSMLNPRHEDKYAIAANGYMLQWRRYMQIRSVHTGEMLLTWNSKKIDCSKQMQANTSGALLLMNVESVINGVAPSIMTEAHIERYLQYVASTLRDTDRETTVLCVGGPECQQMAAQDADWLQCENCRAWWHRACAGHMHPSSVFYCTSCQQRIISVNSSMIVMDRDEDEDEINEIDMMAEEDDKENDESITENNLDEDVDSSSKND